MVFTQRTTGYTITPTPLEKKSFASNKNSATLPTTLLLKAHSQVIFPKTNRLPRGKLQLHLPQNPNYHGPEPAMLGIPVLREVVAMQAAVMGDQGGFHRVMALLSSLMHQLAVDIVVDL